MTDQYLKDLCEQNRDPKAKGLLSLEELSMSGKKPRGFDGTPEEFYKSFFTEKMTPNMGIVEGDRFQLYFRNRTAYPVIPTDVSQIEFAKKQILKTYPKEVYGVEDIDIEYDEIEEVPVGKFNTKDQLNPKDHFFAIYGSKPGDFYFTQGDQNYKWVTGRTRLLEIGDAMPVSEKKGTIGTCYLITPKDYCPENFYHWAMKHSYNGKRFVKQVICEPDKDKFIHVLETCVNALQKNDAIILDDFQEVLRQIKFSHLGILIQNNSGKGSVLFSDKDARMFKSYYEICQLQEFAVTKPFVEKFQQAFRELNEYY